MKLTSKNYIFTVSQLPMLKQYYMKHNDATLAIRISQLPMSNQYYMKLN